MSDKINQIKTILKKINYPGFNRDIISFGMVKQILEKEDKIIILLQINSENKNNIIKLQKNIKENLQKNGFNKIEIELAKPNTHNAINNNHETQSQQTLPNIKHIIAVASGKGGVGKSTIAINIASALSNNFKVGVLDLDIYGPSLPTLININDQPNITEEKMLIPIKKYNMHFMSFGFINQQNAPTIWRGPMVARMTQQFFDNVDWPNLDFLILDLPPGTGDIQLTLVQKIALTGAIIITTPQQLALIDVQKAADMFDKVNTPVIGVIENMTHFICPGCDTITKIFPGSGGEIESSRLKVPLLGKIYLSPEMTQTAEDGTPYVLKYKDSVITNEFNMISSQISQTVNNNFNVANNTQA